MCWLVISVLSRVYCFARRERIETRVTANCHQWVILTLSLPTGLAVFAFVFAQQMVRSDGQSHGEEQYADAPLQPQVHRRDPEEAGELALRVH